MFNTMTSRTVTSLMAMVLVMLLSACGGGGSGNSTTPTPTTPAPTTPAAPVPSAVSLSATLTSINSDNSNTTTVTAIVVDTSNAVISGATVTFSADTGILSAATATTDAAGKAVVTFSSGTTNPANRTATITATSGQRTATLPIALTGSTIDLVATGTSLVAGGAATNLTVTVKNASAVPVVGAAVTVSSAGSGTLAITPINGTTNANGQFIAAISGTAAGTATVTVSALGATRTIAYVIASGTSAFSIVNPASDIVGTSLTVPQVITVQAPAPTTSVVFATSFGKLDGVAQSSITKPVVNGQASVSLGAATDSQGQGIAGLANVLVYDASTGPTGSRSDTLAVAFTSATATKITIQSQPTVVAPNIGGTAGVSTLTATVTDALNNPVGSAAVVFQILTPTGGGESVSPVVVTTANIPGQGVALGQARTTFTAGSLPSGARGVQVRATVVGTNVSTEQVYPSAVDVTPSGPDASIVIGGTAGSITIGRSSVTQDTNNGTTYTLPISVLVADSNGNPVVNSTVSLSAWPIAYRVGIARCALTAPSDPVQDAYYFNEDLNENLILDANEDGQRIPYGPNVVPAQSPTTNPQLRDGALTPANSSAGTLPSTVTTGPSGVATFNLVYTKSNALIIIDRIRASTLVQGTETVGEVRFLLPALLSDIGPPCVLPPSPYPN